MALAGTSHDAAIRGAIETLEQNAPLQTDGMWLEELTPRVASLLSDWDVAECWRWGDWPDRDEVMPEGTPSVDSGIDAVARGRSDGRWIAIQVKSRRLAADGTGEPVRSGELDKFLAASADRSIWAERWLVTNGAVGLGGYSPGKAAMSGAPVKVENLRAALVRQRDATAQTAGDEDCEHCGAPDDPDAIRSRGCMQNEAVETSVRLLREHADSNSGGSPLGEARGRIVLPCGTGKTRIALRIVERLTRPRQVSVVLCPSIALVAQIRREFLQHASRPLRALAVCSDETAGYDPNREGNHKRAMDPTADNSNVSASEIKGLVTTDPEVIANWMSEARSDDSLAVVFGTYQSAARVSEALAAPNSPELAVLVCDEAHRTAGLRRVKKADEQARVENFLLCHDREAFPAEYRVYQTATPRLYNTVGGGTRRAQKPGDLLVRSMDDETVFGVDLYRKTYVEAVRNGWLSDYRIIALAVSDQQAYEIANELARDAEREGGSKLTSMDFLRGLAFALAMAGATRAPGTNDGVVLSSAIGFLNTVKKSETMSRYLQTDKVREWLNERTGGTAAPFALEHLDAKHNVAARDSAKRKLADASPEQPFGILNVGIFGEGTDSPTLSAVAFLESRKSPVDVVQAVGRAMRSAPGKELGYIIVPIVIPPNADPETWLAESKPEEGWSELGQILLALRAHDTRIEDELADLMTVYAPPVENELELKTVTFVAVAAKSKRIRYGVHSGPPGAAEAAVKQAAASGEPLSGFDIEPVRPDEWTADNEPARIVAAKQRTDGSIEVRADTAARDRPSSVGGLGRVNAERTKKAARDIINKGTGTEVQPRRARRPRPTAAERDETQAERMLASVGDLAESITVNLLARSGLTQNRVGRDLNILRESVAEAAHHLRADAQQARLDKHFGLDNLAADERKKQADGCTVAALVMMNAAMLHQRVAAGGWIRGIDPLTEVKNHPQVVDRMERNWERITRQDFLPVIEPAREAIYAIQDTGKLAGLERALRHIASEAERIAETYADMGADHAGPLFNKVMGNQASDGAFFTRPPAATMAARLALDACGEQDWTDPHTWRQHKAVDLACGSGTLLAALLTDMKRRARSQGANDQRLAELQRLAVEEVLKGMDINPVSLQLAATQLTAGNRDIKYRNMGLYLMPYGPTGDPMVPTAAGTLELIAEPTIVPASQGQMFAGSAQGSAVRASLNDPEVEAAADAAAGARIVLMNPPFTERERMGEKFPKTAQQSLRNRTDSLERVLVDADPELEGFVSKRSIRPMFAALADRCTNNETGILAMILPTVALANHSGLHERLVLADRFTVHTILTCHQPGNINLSQHTSINESIVVLRRRDQRTPPPGGGDHQPRQVPQRRHRGGRTVHPHGNVPCRCARRRLGPSLRMARRTNPRRRLDRRHLAVTGTRRSGSTVR